MSERETTHWFCRCGEVLNSRKARDHICPEAVCKNCGRKGVGVHTCKGPRGTEN